MNFKDLQTRLRTDCRLCKDAPVVIGVSGGPDSLCLCHLLATSGYACVAAHFDHNLRPESAAEAGQVKSFAQQMGIPFAGGSADVGAFARQERLSVEEAARILRYRFLFAEARQRGAQAVAVAHHADDQVETVLMHLLRGSGLGGLTGMSFFTAQTEWDDSIPLVRPLLGTWRAEIWDYCRANNLNPVQDRTNEEPIFLRNRVRLELIPNLETYNPQIKSALWRLAQTLEGDGEILSQATDNAWARCCKQVYREEVHLSAREFETLPQGMKRRILRRAVSCLLAGLDDIDFETIERGLAFARQSDAHGMVELSAGAGLIREGEDLVVLTRKGLEEGEGRPRVDRHAQIRLEVPGKTLLSDGWQVTADVLTAGEGKPWEMDGDPYQAWLDLDAVTGELYLRSRRPGDRFSPLGLEGHAQKLSDFMVNNNLPRRARGQWPLLVAGAGIAWVPGYRPAHFCRVTGRTKRILHLRLHREA